MRILFVLILSLTLLFCVQQFAFAKHSTWDTVGKGLAVYEGAKVLTGAKGNMLDDVSGGNFHRDGGSSGGGSSSQDSYNSGYQAGYQSGYNAGFRAGTQQK
ncbi:hypothetical protein M0R36_03160 [bacterium]|jgi:hypothetical protein|nr:hypothetical protein [bacterium]